jgi:CRISPR system Cascade subunit CasA
VEVQQAEKEFNLLYEPWILVKNKQNETKEWSLLDVFKHAHEAQQLAGELPTQDVAIMRLLLAIMHGAFVTSDIEDAEEAMTLWKELWELKQFPYDIIESYLKKYEDRFWLFHPQHPFYQVNDIVDVMNCYKAAKGKKTKDEEKLKTVARLIGELFQSDNLPRLFSGRNGEQQCALNYDEAARWLLHLNGFDDDSAKNPTPKGVGYLGQMGLIYAQGEELFETLMLNFVLLDNNNQLFNDCKETSKAYWEKSVCKIVENLISQPNAQKELLTMQSRRILLKREHRQVIGYLLTMGDYFDKEQGLFNEQMTLWKADEKIGFVPKRHMPEKQIWRDFSSIISTGGDNSISRDSGVIRWIKGLQSNEIISKNIVKMCIVGSYYKPKGAGWQIVDFVNDSLQVNSTILGMLGVTWVNEIIRILSSTDKAISALGWLADDIAVAEGNSSKDHKEMRKAVREQGYHQLDGAFRKWILSIHPQKDDMETKMAEWLAIAKKLIFTQGEQILEQCSNKALVGRIKKDKDDKLGNVNCFEAFIKFKTSVIHVLG